MTDFSPSFAIADRLIGQGTPCFVIAEAGVAHFGDMNKARRLVDLAVQAKCDVVKFQHFRVNTLFGPSAADWRRRMSNRQLTDEQMAEVNAYALVQDIPFICTGHDEESLDFLDRVVNVPAFKIGSGEVENWPFLQNIARRGKPIILSTGLYTLDLIREAISVIAGAGCNRLAILHCVTAYPADPSSINLDVMRQIREFFPGPVGYSDHTAGTVIPLAAVALGAQLIEKHISLDFNLPDAQDWKVSCGPEDFAQFVAEVRTVEAARGGTAKQLSDAESSSVLWARKSIAAAHDIREGTRITADMLILQRPGDGLPGTAMERVVGTVAKRPIQAGTKIALDMLATP
jgi:N-acetylneuraminate synthase/N,N'-diacetyllegionaminate synthase